MSIFSQLLTHARNVYINSAVEDNNLIAPHSAHDMLTREYRSPITEKQRQYVELLTCQRHLLAIDTACLFQGIDNKSLKR